MDKKLEVKKYSDPREVKKRLNQYFNKSIDLYYSTKKDKKYMIKNPKTNKWVHFGAMGFSDMTKHNDNKRRLLFRLRNKSWAIADKLTPAWLAYYILW